MLSFEKLLRDANVFSEFTLLLGTNIVNLQGHQKLPEFDIVNSDILRVETIDDVTNAS